MERILNYVADMNGDLEQFLKSKGYSSRICNLLKKELGLVKVNGRSVFVKSEIVVGDEVTVRLIESPNKVLKYDAKVDIVYEDDDLAVINKSPDIAVIASNAHYGVSLMNALANVWGDFVYHPVNRLDRGTSGLMIVAKHMLAHSILSRRIEAEKDSSHKSILREYIAIAHGRLEGSGVIDAPIGQPYVDSMKRGVCEGGKYAKTLYDSIDCNDNYSIVKVRLVTGRTHQIRVHTSYINHPLVGDTLYGGSDLEIARPCLHSAKISFKHPITNESMVFSADLPSDMRIFAEKAELKTEEKPLNPKD